MSSTTPAEKSSRRGLITLVACFAALFLVVVVVAQVTGGAKEGQVPRSSVSAGEASGTPSVPPYADSPFADRAAGDARAIGDVDAPVVVTMWTDFRCPFCAVFNQETLPDLVKSYVDTGKVRLEVRDITLFGEHSEAASVAALAAGRQGRYFEYMSTVYAAAPERAQPDMPRAKLVKFARTAGVPDLAAFTKDLDDPTLVREARQGTESARASGVTSVPFFVAGGVSVSGAQPAEVFRGFLDASLDAARPAAAR